MQSLETGYRVTSDLRLKAEPEEDKLSLTCIATSQGHDGEIMTKETNFQIMVLSKSIHKTSFAEVVGVLWPAKRI